MTHTRGSRSVSFLLFAYFMSSRACQNSLSLSLEHTLLMDYVKRTDGMRVRIIAENY